MWRGIEWVGFGGRHRRILVEVEVHEVGLGGKWWWYLLGDSWPVHRFLSIGRRRKGRFRRVDVV